jgi:uncharacterized Zn ribbon protein
MCKECKDNWQREKGGKYKCPSCNNDKKPRKLSRLENEGKESILFKC